LDRERCRREFLQHLRAFLIPLRASNCAVNTTEFLSQTGDQWAASLSKALGQPVKYNAVPFDVYRKLGFPGADDLGNMFQYKHDFNDEFTGARSIEKSRELNPQLQSFDQWLEKNKTKIPIG
jgi:hypothetical protein